MTAVVDSNVSGRGGARWRFVVAAVGRLGALRAAEGDAEGVDGVALEAESDVGVDGGGDADVGVAEEWSDPSGHHNKIVLRAHRQGLSAMESDIWLRSSGG
ncbi:hypothetical protein SHKM778_73750 [Streptomyces sp. KM77-8]|uniref:Uncharacterized protein n=1 Tax=Streptomyces haneummycinicus TaxID=3074435 RepID=A0AAT9HUN3_9ACTN